MPPDLSIVVPARNAATHLPELVESVRAVPEIATELIIVDDASTDATPELALNSSRNRVSTVRLPSQVGAGAARNVGFGAASGRYTLFFDSDDEIHPDTLVNAITLLDRSDADLAMTTYRYDDGTTGTSKGMLTPDVEIWREYIGSARERVVRIPDTPRLLEFTNYPWNKVLRTDHFRSQGLRFGETPVHNDIHGHWAALLQSNRILLLDEPLCTHVVPAGGRNLTNRTSAVRLALFDALDETYDDFLADYPDRRRLYSVAYWSLVMKTAAWARERTPATHLREFTIRLQDHLLRLSVRDYARLRRQNPALARSIADHALD